MSRTPFLSKPLQESANSLKGALDMAFAHDCLQNPTHMEHMIQEMAQVGALNLQDPNSCLYEEERARLEQLMTDLLTKAFAQEGEALSEVLILRAEMHRNKAVDLATDANNPRKRDA